MPCFHIFNKNVAKEYGLVEAILLQNIQYWVEKNQANRKHFHDGRYWTYNSIIAFSELFSYLTAKKISKALNGLVGKGVLLTGNYNTSPYDRTKWYSVSEAFTNNGSFHLPKKENGQPQKGEPIPDVNTNKKHIKKESKKENASADASQVHAPSSGKVTARQKLSAKGKRKERAKGLLEFYSNQLLEKYNVPVVKTDNLNKTLCKILDAADSETEAEGLIKFYMQSDNKFFVQNVHSLGILENLIGDILTKFRVKGNSKKPFKYADLRVALPGLESNYGEQL